MNSPPVLFIIFNRIETTKLVFSRIKEARPARLFIAADGPRKHKPDDIMKCQEVRDYVLGQIDWDCKVDTLFRTQNVGCGMAPSKAITWFFDNVEEGIILEDDCLPVSGFFPFCMELLERYRNDERVMSISGTNLLGEIPHLKESYLFSEYGGIWGWASWKRAWAGYDYRIAAWEDNTVKEKFKKRYAKGQYLFFQKIFDSVNDASTWWDYQWWFHKLSHDGFDIMPKVNLVKNIGFDVGATHTQSVDTGISGLRVGNIDFPLVHPVAVKVDKKFDRHMAKRYYWFKRKKSLVSRMLKLIKR